MKDGMDLWEKNVENNGFSTGSGQRTLYKKDARYNIMFNTTQYRLPLSNVRI